MSGRLLSCGALMLAAVCAATSHPRAQTTEPAYVVRGRVVEVRQRALTTRVEQVHDALAIALTARAPDLLPQLEPPPSPIPGYQVLPRLVADAERTPSRAQVVSFYWGWTEKLIAGQMTALDTIDDLLARAATASSADQHGHYVEATRAYQKVIGDRRAISADVNYNWHWMKAVHENRATHDALQRVQDAAVERDRLDAALDAHDDAALRASLKDRAPADAAPTALRDAARARVDALTSQVNAHNGYAAPRPFLDFTQPSPGEWLLTVRVYTDIADEGFVRAFAEGMESRWRVDDEAHGVRYRAKVLMTRVSSAELYCGTTPATDCRVPAAGDAIDVDAHVARFPTDGGVLTTGAATLRFVGNTAIVLSASDVSLRTLAHELGHTFGFPDAYFRGYADMGVDGYRITEFGSPSDIMSAPSTGPVLARHFELLLGARSSEWVNRSLAFYREQRYQESLDAAKQALTFSRDNALAWNNVAAAQASLQQWEAAVEAATEALRLDPQLRTARANLAWAQTERDKASAAPR